MLKVIKVRIYPDTSQKVLLAKAFGSCRWLWNHFLNLINETYKVTGKGLSSYDVKKLVANIISGCGNIYLKKMSKEDSR